MPRTMLDPMFQYVTAAEFTEQHLAALLAGTCAAVRIPSFLDPAACQRMVDVLDQLPVHEYDRSRVAEPILRFGPALNDFRIYSGRLDGHRYWPEADRARAAWAMARPRHDPIALALGRLGTAWGSAVTPATIGGRPVFGGTVRELNRGALTHYDEVVRELPGLFDQHVVGQLAFNAWVIGPDSGGETRISRRRWQPADDEHRFSYGYSDVVTADSQQVELVPKTGEALLFNPANYHSVKEAVGRRVALAFFLGLTTRGELVAWS
ncbi:hypothetical protein P3T36_000948 [Kitasatospora sp. MAP12-15]|uniref:proline hydroxylase n=1 Tax=unclassified Kitasatospora TaxID=2633591 RepID=UPI0024746256|nr:proline hydroxylase [Kitasatospora sp. MAP12-44]MDH6114548.1 hypothetical protein [Kitasatospora sp. MAP12-44]